MSTKESLLQEMDNGFEELLAALGTSPHLAPSADGQWGLFELLSHFAGWHRFSAARLRRLALGEDDTPPSPEDEMNAAFVAERRSLTGAVLLDELHSSFQELRAAVVATPDTHFWRGRPGEEDSLAYFIASENGHEHYREHAEDIGVPAA